MLPVSASDLIEFRPASERVAVAAIAHDQARADLEKIEPDQPSPKKKGAAKSDDLATAEMVLLATADVLAGAEADRAKSDPVFLLRVPTVRTKSAVERDIMAEAIVIRSNLDVIDAAIESDEITEDDRGFLKAVRTAAGKSGVIPEEEWGRVYQVARGIPKSAKIIADWLHQANVRRLHIIRHHLVIDGERSPFPERVFDRWMEENGAYAALVGNKIDSMMSLTKAAEKN